MNLANLPTLDQVEAEMSKRSHIKFIKRHWMRRDKFLIGEHTRAIGNRLDQAIKDFRKGISTFLVIKVPFRHGKALALDTPIPTPSGWSNIHDLKVGDFVYSPSGRKIKVIAKSEVFKNRKVYLIDVDSGKEIIKADENHLWETKLDRRQNYKIYDTKTLANPRRFSCPVKMSQPLKNRAKNLLISPYVLGVWLGDGKSTMGYIYQSKDDYQNMIDEIEKDGYLCEAKEKPGCYRILVKGLSTDLKKLKLINNKHIPKQYLRGSYNQRLSLLQGLIDTDGEVGGKKPRPGKDFDKTGGQVTFTNTNRVLAFQVLELVRTLGVKASITEFTPKLYGKECKTGYKVSFYLKDCCRLERKRERARNSERFIEHSINVVGEEIADTQCIQVDSEDGMFLCGKTFLPTHNSDLVSRYLPARFLGLFPDQEVLLATYAASLSNDLSKDCRKILKSETFQKTFPKVKISRTSASVEAWGLEDNAGKFNAAGLLGGMTGKGYALGILDDYLKNREEAESETIRNKGWDEFTNSFLTRRAPVSITIVMATPWHTDDIIGRIEQKIKDDPNFPKFEIIAFPAKSEKYATGFLFPERFTEEWYKGQFSALGTYGASALLQCSPITRGGRIIKVDRVQYYDGEPPKGLQFIRAWDLALSAKERDKDDPDYSVGIKLAVYREKKFNNFYLDHLYIDDIIRGRWGTTDRDRIILQTATQEEIDIFAEYTGLFKDSYAHLSDVLHGHRTIGKVSPSKDLMIRSAAIEPIFEAGNVYMRRAEWNQPFLAELAAFPGDKHDDQLAALVTGYEATKKNINRNYFFKGAM